MIDLTDVFEFFQQIYLCIPSPVLSLVGVLAVFGVASYIRNAFAHQD